MKAAEEWATDIHGIKWLDNSHPTMTNVVKQIQLDAMKEGARRAAAEIQNQFSVHDLTALQIEQAILTTAENWTIKNL